MNWSALWAFAVYDPGIKFLGLLPIGCNRAVFSGDGLLWRESFIQGLKDAIAPKN